MQCKVLLGDSLQSKEKCADHINDQPTVSEHAHLNDDTTVIKAENAFLSWHKDDDYMKDVVTVKNSESFLLKNISLVVDRGNNLMKCSK